MTLKRVRFLQNLLAFVGLEGRLRLEWISSAEAQRFAMIAREFTEEIQTLGPSPITLRRKLSDEVLEVRASPLPDHVSSEKESGEQVSPEASRPLQSAGGCDA